MFHSRHRPLDVPCSIPPAGNWRDRRSRTSCRPARVACCWGSLPQLAARLGQGLARRRGGNPRKRPAFLPPTTGRRKRRRPGPANRYEPPWPMRSLWRIATRRDWEADNGEAWGFFHEGERGRTRRALTRIPTVSAIDTPAADSPTSARPSAAVLLAPRRRTRGAPAPPGQYCPRGAR